MTIESLRTVAGCWFTNVFSMTWHSIDDARSFLNYRAGTVLRTMGLLNFRVDKLWHSEGQQAVNVKLISFLPKFYI